MEEVIGLLEDILQEFGHKPEISLQTSRIIEMLERLKKERRK